jgi:hypothetical protein
MDKGDYKCSLCDDKRYLHTEEDSGMLIDGLNHNYNFTFGWRGKIKLITCPVCGDGGKLPEKNEIAQMPLKKTQDIETEGIYAEKLDKDIP